MHSLTKNVFHIILPTDKKNVENALWKTDAFFLIYGFYDSRCDGI